MAGILSVNSHVDNRSHVRAVVPLSPYGIHQFRITHTNNLFTDFRSNTFSRYLLDVAHLTSVRSLVREGVAQGCSDGVRRIVFHVCSQVQQLVFIEAIWMYGLNGKLSVRQCTRLVKYYRADL